MNKIYNGLITHSYGRQFIVEIDGKIYQAVTKAKKTDYVVGDIVEVNVLNSSQAQIITLLPRQSLIFRSDSFRSKLIASNISQIIIVIAVKPTFNVNFLNSCLLAAEHENIKPIIIINKIDLDESYEFLERIIKLYSKELGYLVLTLSAIDSAAEMLDILNNNSNLLIGQSGVGKSTITNQIISQAKARTGEITKSQTSGSHTTTNATLYHINSDSSLIDCPGLHEFGLNHLTVDNFAYLFPEYRPFVGNCKFRNCRHLLEPGCSIIQAINNNEAISDRLNFLQYITKKLLQI